MRGVAIHPAANTCELLLINLRLFIFEKSDTKLNLEYRTLGKTGLRVTIVGYGAMRTTDSAVLQRALDLGINFVDTAHGYQDGNNELMVGKVIAPRRKEIILCTKIPAADKGRFRQYLPDSTTKSKMEDWFETSLQRLKTDYVDILYLHNSKTIDDIHNEAANELFSKWKTEGKIRFMGFSTHSNEAELLEQAAKDKFWDVILVAYNFKKEEALTKAVQAAAAAGIGIVAMKTQAGGYKTDALGDVSPHQAALKWVLQNPAVHTTIPSMTTFAELEEDVQVMGQKMGWHDRKILHRYSQAIDKHYCRSCGACIETCPHGMDSPELNRCLMYYQGYGDLNLARTSFNALPFETKCVSCSYCRAQCKYGIDLASRMALIPELFA